MSGKYLWFYGCEEIWLRTYLLLDLLLLLVAYTVPSGLGLTLRFILLDESSVALLACISTGVTISALIINSYY